MVFKCKMCDATLPVNPGERVITCEYCGSEQTLPGLGDERLLNLYDRASHYRRNNEFDKAQALYEQILEENPGDSEIYWSVILCKYGIEYVEEGGKRVPTVNRTQTDSIFDDIHYQSALKYATPEQSAVYEAEAKRIDEIQKDILAISRKEEPFDIFICYKETDEQGRRTLDSVLATDIYELLTKEDYKVFFSRVTLDDKIGVAYEPYIYAALQSAKIMIAVGTKEEHFNAIWVRNEWSRYLAMIKSGAKKVLIPAYKDMDPYDLPEEFSHLQAQDMSKLGFFHSYDIDVSTIYDMSGRSMQGISDSIAGLLGFTKNSAGKYVRSKVGQIAYVSIKCPSVDYGHAITCWGFSTNSAGVIDSLYITDSDDGKYAMSRVYLKKKGDRIYLYRNAACTKKMYGKYDYYLSQMCAINTTNELVKKYKTYNSSATPLVWNGRKRGDTWTASERNYMPVRLPSTATGWSIETTDNEYFPTYYSTRRHVLFDDYAADSTVYISGAGTVRAQNMTIDSSDSYVFRRKGTALLNVRNLEKLNSGTATLTSLKLKFGNIFTRDGILQANGSGIFSGSNIGIYDGGSLRSISRQSWTLTGNILVYDGAEFLANSAGRNYTTLKLRSNKSVKFYNGSTFTLNLDSTNLTYPVISMTGKLVFGLGSTIRISGLSALTKNKNYRLVKIKGFNKSYLRNVSISGGVLGYTGSYIIFKPTYATAGGTSGGSSSGGSSSGGSGGSSSGGSGSGSGSGSGTSTPSYNTLVTSNSSTSYTLGSGDTLTINSSADKATRLTGRLSGSGTVVVPSGHSGLIATNTNYKLNAADTLSLSVAGIMYLGYSNQGVTGSLPKISVAGTGACCVVYREGASGNVATTIPTLALSDGGRLELTPARSETTSTGSTDLSITRLSLSGTGSNQLYCYDDDEAAYNARNTTIDVGLLTGTGDLKCYGNTRGRLSMFRFNGTSSYSGDVTLAAYARYGVTSGFYNIVAGEFKSGSYGVVKLDIVDDTGDSRALLGISGNVTMKGVESSLSDKTVCKLYSGSMSTVYDTRSNRSPLYGVSSSTNTLTIDSNSYHSFYGELYGPLNIVKKGTGTQTFDGLMDQYKGSLTVSGGTLQLTGDSSQIQNIVVNSGKLALRGANMSAQNVTVNSGAILDTHDTSRAFTVKGTVTLNNGGRIDSYHGVNFKKTVVKGINNAITLQSNLCVSLMDLSFSINAQNKTHPALTLTSTATLATTLTHNLLYDSNVTWSDSRTGNTSYKLMQWNSSKFSYGRTYSTLSTLKNNSQSGFYLSTSSGITTLCYYVAPGYYAGATATDEGEGADAVTTEPEAEVTADEVMKELEELIALQKKEEKKTAGRVANALVQTTWSSAAANRAYIDCLENRAGGAGVLAKGKGLAWAAALGVSGRHSGSGGYSGSEYHLGGAAMGVEALMGGSSTLGLSVGNSWGKVGTFGVSSVDQDVTHMALYGQSNLLNRAHDSLSLLWVAAYGRTENEANFMGAPCDWSQDSTLLTARLTYNYRLSDRMVAQMFSGLEYLATDSGKPIDGCESGSLQNLRGEIGLGISYHPSDSTQLYGHVSFVGDMVRHNPKATVSGWRMPGLNPGRAGVNVSVGVSHSQ